MDLHRRDAARGQLGGGEAVEQYADVGDVVHVTAKVDVRRADRIAAHELRLRQVVREAGGAIGDAGVVGEREIGGKAGLRKLHQLLFRAEDGPLRAPEGEQRVAAAQTVAAVAAHGLAVARLRPCCGSELIHETCALQEDHTRVDGQPELAALRHRRAADADELGVLGGDALKDGKGRKGRELRRGVAVVGRDGDAFFKNALLHSCLRCAFSSARGGSAAAAPRGGGDAARSSRRRPS